MKNLVQIKNNQATTISTTVADVFNKNHYDVTRRIEALEIPDDWRARNFTGTVVERPNPSGGAPIQSKAYEMTKDGFVLLAMGFTGKKAMAFKLAYIDAFNKMEKALSDVFVPEPAMMLPSPDFTNDKEVMKKLGGMVKRCCATAMRDTMKDAVVIKEEPTSGYPFPAWLSEKEVTPDAVERELTRLVKYLDAKKRELQTEGLRNLHTLLNSVKSVLVRYKTIQAETAFTANMMRKGHYTKDNVCDEMSRINVSVSALPVSV